MKTVVYEEEENIPLLHERIAEAMGSLDTSYEVVYVDDGSRDRTGVILDTIAEAYTCLRVIHHPVNRGYGAALVSGFEAVTKDLAFFMDSDGQFDIHDLEQFFPLIGEFDGVLGYRIHRQDTWMRKVNAWGWKILVGMVFGVYVRDVDCAFKLYRADFFRERPSNFENRGPRQPTPFRCREQPPTTN